MAVGNSSCDDDNIRREVESRVNLERMTWRRGYYDFCLIHAEDDMEAAVSFRDRFCKEYSLTGIMESDADMSSIASEFDRIEEMVNRSTKTFLFITERFDKDKLCRLQKNELLARHIRSRQHILPIYIEHAHLDHVPWGLTGMIGFKMFQEQKEKRRIIGTFNDTVRAHRIAREVDENRRLEQKASKLRLKIRKEVEAEYRRNAECAKSEEENDNEVCNSRATNFTNINKADSVVCAPIYNINVEGGGVLHFNPTLRNNVRVLQADTIDVCEANANVNSNENVVE